MKLNQILFVFLFLSWAPVAPLLAGDSSDTYKIRQGDILDISVWGDDTLNKQVRVLPDGSISFPLVGQVSVAGHSPADVDGQITTKLKTYLPDPEVNVIVQSTEGNRVYIIGKVNTPGVIPLQGPMTVLQALSISGGFDKFAELDEIKILRGKQVMPVNYSDLIRGRNLASNHLLQADDTILVP